MKLTGKSRPGPLDRGLAQDHLAMLLVELVEVEEEVLSL